MSTGLRIIPADEIALHFPSARGLEPYTRVSNPIFLGTYHSEPFCLVGLIPQQESGVVAIWGWNSPLVADHPYIYARWGRRLIHRIHTLYPTIIGQCPLAKLKWLRSLGATFTFDTNHLATFRIEAPQ